MKYEQAVSIVGGASMINIASNGVYTLIEAIRAGLPVAAVESLINKGRLTLTELELVIMSRKTFYHRRRRGFLTAEQSDRLLRVAYIIALSEETFASKDKAHAWLRHPNRALADNSPLSLLDTEQGCHEVECVLGRIGHGISA